MSAAKAIRFIERLEVPEGPLAGRKVRLAPFQKTFVRGALARNTSVAALSVARGNAKSALAAGMALATLLGEIDSQPRREIILAARTRDQARVLWQYCAGFCRSLAEDHQKRLIYRRSPNLEIEFQEDGGGHVIRAISADGKSALGLSPVLVICDERAFWPADQGAELEASLLSALGKRRGRALLISTSGPDDQNAFSRWLDNPPEGTYVQEHRADDGCAPDDLEQILKANPGSKHGIGSSPEWLLAEARRAIARGGSALQSFRLLNLNQRCSAENRDVLLTTDQWLACETAELPPREGPVVIGIDLGGSASMTAAAFYWPQTGRLECLGWFPSRPSLLDRGQADGVGNRYVEMQARGELAVLGDRTVPVAAWLVEVVRHVEGEQISALVMDRYKQAELGQAIDAAGIRAPLIWRGMGYRDGSEDVDRFRRACFDGRVRSAPSLLVRSACGDAVCLRDPANNLKLAKARSIGRIDAASASVLAVAEGARQTGRTSRKTRSALWI